MDRAQKQEAIETLKSVFAESGAVVVTHNLGLTVAEMTNLRGRLREQGAQLKVVKNTLAQKALNGSVGEEGDDKTGVSALATLPSLDQLRGKIIGLVQAPATKIAGILQAPAGQLARVMGAYAAKDAA